MSTSHSNLEARRLAEVVERRTGQFYCQSGAHYAKGESILYRGRRVCMACKTRLDEITRKQRSKP